MTRPLAGLLVVAAVLVAATAFGLARRARDGRLRPAPQDAADVFAGLGAEPGEAFALAAAFLNAAFGFCLGCEMYLLLRRLTARP